jgi:hypothetical protein
VFLWSLHSYTWRSDGWGCEVEVGLIIDEVACVCIVVEVEEKVERIGGEIVGNISNWDVVEDVGIRGKRNRDSLKGKTYLLKIICWDKIILSVERFKHLFLCKWKNNQGIHMKKNEELFVWNISSCIWVALTP